MNFDQLRLANLARLHVYAGCEDWTPADWLTAFVGEVGEAANIAKKIRRGDFAGDAEKQEAAMAALRKEFADIQTYLDLWAAKYEIDLGEATREKWNEVSHRVGSNLSIDADGILCEGVERGTPGNRNMVPGLRLHQCELVAGLVVRYGNHTDDIAQLVPMRKPVAEEDGVRATALAGGLCWLDPDSPYGICMASFRDQIKWRRLAPRRAQKSSVDMR